MSFFYWLQYLLKSWSFTFMVSVGERMPFKNSEFTELGRYTDYLLDLIDAKGV